MGQALLCMDGRMLGGRGTGVATYAEGLRQAQALIGDRHAILAASGGYSPLGRFLAATRRRPVPVFAASQDTDGIRRLVARDVFRRAHVHFSRHRRLLRLEMPEPGGIMHWTYPVPIAAEGWINIYTVHDVIPLERPDLSSVSTKRLRATLEAISGVASRVVTVTDAASRAITRTGLFEQDAVVDCGQVVAPGRVLPGSLPEELAPGRYLLFCGSIEPRKNLVRLLHAYKLSGCPLPLVIAGPDGWQAGPILAEAARTPNVLRLPYLPRDDLVRVMAHARAVLFPSLAEGFGLPMAEAMALGVPTMASDIAAHREVSAGGSILVDPVSIEEMASAIQRLAGDDALTEGLSARGRAIAGRYSLETFAKRLTHVYKAAIAQNMSSA